MTVLIIDGVEMPEPSSLTLTREKIWSSNTGRAADGGMLGDVVARKWTLQIEWPPLTNEETGLINEAIDPAFLTVQFIPTGKTTMQSKTMYAGTPTYPVYSYADGTPRYSGVGVKLVEK